MNQTENISWTVESWIDEEELPVRANLKVIRRNDPNYGLTEDEIQDRNEFIRCYLLEGFKVLLMIPRQTTENDFFLPYLDDIDPDYSAFQTVDFWRQLKPLNKYAYAMRKMMERVKDLAILHSSISSEQGRLDTYRQYEALVERDLRSQLATMIRRFQPELSQERRYELKTRIAELNRRILECNRIWERYAPPENWDH